MVGWLVEGFTSHIIHYRSYQRQSSRLITWQILAKLNQTTTRYSLKLNKNLNNLLKNYKRTPELNVVKLKPGLGASHAIQLRN